MACTGTTWLTDCGATPGQDCTDALAAAVKNLKAAGGGTLQIPDGVYPFSKTLVLPIGVSLRMLPGSTLKAAKSFEGEAMVETESFSREKRRWTPQAIEGGTLDGSAQPLIGFRTIFDRETDLRNITILNCTRKGVHIGVEGCCETNLLNVRVQCESGVYAEKESIGIHYDKTTDNLVSVGIVIGYETGLRCDSSSNDIQQVHVWNYKENCKLATCFACNGWNDTYNQCYADSPMNGDDEGFGFHVTRPYQRFTNCRVYNNQWVTPDRVIGFRIEDGGTHGTYLGNHFTAGEGREMRAAFQGNFEAATFVGNSFNKFVKAGKIQKIAQPEEFA